MTSTVPSPPTLKSLKHEDIIECILKSVEEKQYHGGGFDFDQKRWLLDVTNDGLDEYGDIDSHPVVDFYNTSQVNFALLHLSKAGKTLNVRKWEEEGIDDFIGTHFPKFKDNPSYQPYPKNYNMNLHTEFNLPQSNADFIKEGFWTENHCDPENWEAPSTYGVPGVYIVHPDGSRLNDSDSEERRRECLHMGPIPRGEKNKTRYQNTVLKRINHYRDVFKEHGVALHQSAIVYDVHDPENKVNGNGRGGAGIKLNFPGYMLCPFEFEDEEALLRYSMKSQPKDDPAIFGEPMSKEDVRTGVLELVRVRGGYDLSEVYKEIEEIGSHLLHSDRSWIKREVKKELEESDDIDCTSPYMSWDDDTYDSWLHSMEEDPWVSEVYDNDEEYVQYINLNNKSLANYYKQILRSNINAIRVGKPLSFVVNFALPTGKSSLTLQGTRDKFFSTSVDTFEQELIDTFNYNIPNVDERTVFAWNHPDARHVTLAQDRRKEEKQVVIPLKNRDFN